MIEHAEWVRKAAPFYWIKVSNIGSERKWSATERHMVTKWLDEHSGGWVYWDQNETYIFEKDVDRIAFKLWAVDDPFKGDHGEVA